MVRIMPSTDRGRGGEGGWGCTKREKCEKKCKSGRGLGVVGGCRTERIGGGQVEMHDSIANKSQKREGAAANAGGGQTRTRSVPAVQEGLAAAS